MTASESYKAGKLQEAVAAQIQEVKAAPGDQAKRLFLFELLAFAGDLDRARKQIDALAFDDPALAAAALAYRQLLEAEAARRTVYRDGAAPQLLVPAPDHVGLRVQALQRLRDGRPAEAVELLSKAQDLAPDVSGTFNGKAFDGLRDCDDLLGGVLEVMAKGKYYWVALEQIESLACTAPAWPRDLLWLPGYLSVKDGPDGDVFLPALYANSHDHADDAVKLGRATDWKQAPGGPTLGVGLKMLLCGDDDISILEWRQLEMLPTGGTE
jgi:type VI secretion system protein ImpE